MYHLLTFYDYVLKTEEEKNGFVNNFFLREILLFILGKVSNNVGSSSEMGWIAL